MPNIFLNLFSLDWSISKIRGISLGFTVPCFIEIYVLNGNSVDHNQMPHSSMSDLDLRCLPMPLLWDSMLSTLSKWVNVPYICSSFPFCLLKMIK